MSTERLVLSEKYKAFLRCDAPVEFLEGTTAAGKTTVGLFKFMCKVAESPKKLHILAADDTGTAEKNIINKDLGILDDFGILAEYKGNGSGEYKMPHILFHTSSGDKIIFVIGYGNKSKWKDALGGQYGCLYIDEVNTANIDFVREASMRCDYLIATLILAKGKLRRYKAQGSLIMYVRSEIMDALEQSTEFTRKIEMTQIAEGGMGIETRVTDIDGVPIMEVIDDERFYDAFDWNPKDGGFAPTGAVYKKTEDADIVKGKEYYTTSDEQSYSKVESPVKESLSTYYEKAPGSHKINVLIACGQTCKTVPKINSIYYFAPGTHTKGDGYLYQNRSFSDVFVFPNGRDGKIDSVYADVDTEEYTATEE